MGLGIVFGALSGAGENVAKSLSETQKFHDEESLMQERAALETEKAKIIAQNTYDIQNAPQNRAGGLIQQAAQQEIPVTASPVTTLSGNDPANIGSKEWEDGKGLVGMSRVQVQAYNNPDMLAQYDRQIAADNQTAQDAVVGQTRKQSPQEAMSTAYQAAIDKGDMQAAAAIKAMIPEKTITVGKDATILDAATNKPIFSNTAGIDKEQLKIESDRKITEIKERQKSLLEAMRIDPLGINAPPGGYMKAIANAGSQNVQTDQIEDQTNGGTLAERLQGKTGDEALNELPSPIANRVKAILEGREAFPSTARNNPRNAQLLDLAAQVDPSFDAINFNRRNQTAVAFSKGKQADAVRAANQTIAHMGKLYDAIDNLDNFTGIASPLNYVVNPTEKLFGDQRQGLVQQDVQAVSSELRKVFSGSGGGSLNELKQWEDSIPLNASKTAQKAYLLNGVELLHGAIDSLQNQYEQGMGQTAAAEKPLLSKQSHAILEKIQGKPTNSVPSNQSAPSIPNGWTVQVH